MSASDTSLPKTAAASFDPGLTQKYTGLLKRIVNRDGAFNVRRDDKSWTDANPYTYLISVSWTLFTAIVTAAFTLMNIAFAWLYSTVAAGHIKGAESKNAALYFLNLFFFSTHTLTTVGYGNMYPEGVVANALASLEALFGLMAFAIATGLLFGRFSRPSARFGFSSTLAIAPYQDGTSVQFRVVNRRTNNLIEVEARVMLMAVELANGEPVRKFTQLTLERNQIMFLPLTWTVVHPIDDKSPFFGKTPQDLEKMQAEVVVMMRGFDETFGQVVYARYSYRYDEIQWGVKFSTAFDVEASGDLVLHANRVGKTEPAPLPQVQ